MSLLEASADFDSDDFAGSYIFPNFTPTKSAKSVRLKIKLEPDAQEAQSGKRIKQEWPETDERSNLDANAATSTGPQILKQTINDVNAILFDGTYYEIVQKMQESKYQGGIVALCKLCPDDQKIKGSLDVSSNFIDHLKHKHPQQFNEFSLRKAECIKSPKTHNHKTTNIDEKLLKFVLDTYAPLHIVEHPAFIDLFRGTGIQLNDQESLEKLLDRKHEVYVANIKEMLSSVTHCCATVDIWSIESRWSFLAYTCNWLDSKTLERRSVALACRRFHANTLSSNETINAIIAHIQYKYKLDTCKIVRTITENLCNFAHTYRQLTSGGTGGPTLALDEDPNIDKNYWDSTVFIPSIPKQLRCLSHALNELASKDFLHILQQDEALRRRHQHAFTRCSSLWHKCGQPWTDAVINNPYNCFAAPAINSWCTLFQCVQKLLANKENLSVLYRDDIEYLEDYSVLMLPIAKALQFLQLKENMYFGNFIATLVSLRVKLRKLYESKQLKYLHNACKDLESSLYQRFQKFFELSDDEALEATIAAISCPVLKLKFFDILQESAKNYTVVSLKQAFIRYAAEFMPPTKQSNEIASTSSCVVQLDEENFLDFGETQTISNDQQMLQELQFELESYLADIDTSLGCLSRYPTIRQLFLKYNTSIISSALVERLFSFTDILKRSQQQNLSDDQFEKLVLMKADKQFV